MRTADFDFPLPAELIAQEPSAERDQSRLMVMSRATGLIAHHRFDALPSFLRPGDVLVLNDSKVIPARLRGINARSGGEFEILLLEENAPNDWWAMMRPGKRARVGTEIVLKQRTREPTPWRAQVMEVNPEGHRRLAFKGPGDITAALDSLGELPLPPYIRRAEPNLREDDRERYQTVYAQAAGSVAAPTAGLHFTPRLLEKLRAMGVKVCHVTLHVGLGTFAPVKADSLQHHVMHEERFLVPDETAREVQAARTDGRRIIAVGTTSMRVLESVAAVNEGRLVAGPGRTRIFIHPPFHFRVADGLVTNFHLPCSTLLMLVSAFAAPGGTAGREAMLRAYGEAVSNGYRFFSYGDAMLIL